jgi:epoxyqueuosine reductase
MDAESRIRARAASLGFSACGFAAAVPLDREAFLAGWIDGGLAGEMGYLQRRPARRLTVAGILPDARTVITLAHPYAPPPVPPVDWRAELRGRVAAYALGDDYHRVLDGKLAALERFLAAERPGAVTRRYVDTGAVLEREWAVRGGLGWFGKNTMVLSTRGGSWFFLAELITNLALGPDAPTTAHCGRCTDCLAACPTGALRDGLVMDAPRCIAYLTIEHRSAISPTLRSQLGPWIFGCDVCQEVCPWNARAVATDGDRYDDATTAWLSPFLPDVLALDEAGFRARFARTPVARAKRRGLLRNVAVALGNTGNRAALPALRRALEDPEPLVREHVAWALGALGGTEARATLERHARREPEASVLSEVRTALAAA